MANINAPRGFLPLRHLDGAPWNHQTQTFLLDSGDATAVFVGDVVKLAGSAGTAGQVVAGVDVEGIATVTKATGTVAAGTSLVGVVVGFSPNPLDLNLSGRYRVASTNRLAFVVTDPSVVYELQEDASGNVLAAADVSLNASFNGGSGSTTTGISTATINNASKATTSTLPLRILGLVKRPDNAFNTLGTGTDPGKFEVIFNASGLAFGGAGIAGT
jgi:hypothetical protein